MGALLKQIDCDFSLSSRERLKGWKAFRSSLKNFSDIDQLILVADYWGKAPLSKFKYQISQPQTWPTAWEMVDENDWCERSLAIAMEFTLRLSGWDSSRLNLQIAKDNDQLIMIVVVDGKTTLNYKYAAIAEYPQNIEVITSIKYINGYVNETL